MVDWLNSPGEISCWGLRSKPQWNVFHPDEIIETNTFHWTGIPRGKNFTPMKQIERFHWAEQGKSID